MVDSRVRSIAGELSEAYKLISNLSLQPDSVILGALLKGWVISNVEMGEVAAKRQLGLKPDVSANPHICGKLVCFCG